jgi:phenylacetic acid degradation operon negative regulatory protein
VAARSVAPKSLLLDLLRVTPRPVAVRQLVTVGQLFGLEGNAIRVALTRLVAGGLVASDERGSYRLAAQADPVNQWVEEWRLGERRMRPWGGGWLCLWHPRGERGERARSRRALERLGFREGREGLWVRPDNLRASLTAVEEQLARLGLAPGALLFVGQDLPAAVIEDWVATLWPIASTAARQRQALRDIERSRARPGRRARGALVESFLVGGAAIRALARDPLLPDAIASGDHRRALTDAMRDYDRRGRAIWKEMLELEPAALDGAPIHLSPLDAP